MKKPYMRTIVSSSGRDYVLIILYQLYGSKAGLNMTPLNLHSGRRANPILI